MHGGGCTGLCIVCHSGEQMNKVFSEYSTGTAFFLQLSKRQCWGVLTCGVEKQWLASGQFISLRKDLEARGLVEWSPKERRCVLTKAGALVAQLLKEAGLTAKNTRTLSVVKGLERWFGRRSA